VKSFLVRLLVSGTICLPAVAASTDYDGRWRLQIVCSAQSEWPWHPPFGYEFPIVLANGQALRKTTEPAGKGLTKDHTWTVGLRDNVLTISQDGTISNGEKWIKSLGGRIVSPTVMEFNGTETDWSKTGWRSVRTCSGKLALIAPGSGEVAGNEPKQGGQPPNLAPLPVPVPPKQAPQNQAPVSPVPTKSPNRVPAPSPIPNASPPAAPPPAIASTNLPQTAMAACQKFPNLCP
jgi:hypothetical protein